MPQRSRHSAALRAAVVLVLALAVSTLSAAVTGVRCPRRGPRAGLQPAGPPRRSPRTPPRSSDCSRGSSSRAHRRASRARRRSPGSSASTPGRRGPAPGSGGPATGARQADRRARAPPRRWRAWPRPRGRRRAGPRRDRQLPRAGRRPAARRPGRADGRRTGLEHPRRLERRVRVRVRLPHPDTQGYGYSMNGGTSFTDGGVPPKLTGWDWASDPLVVVNEKTGDFWYCALVNVNGTQNGIAADEGALQRRHRPVERAHAGARGPQHRAPVRQALARGGLAQRPALPLLHGLQPAGDTIVFQRSNVGGTSWDSPQRLSASAEAGYVQGSRPVVGPDGEVYVAWYSIGSVDADYMRIRKSTDQGATFNRGRRREPRSTRTTATARRGSTAPRASPTPRSRWTARAARIAAASTWRGTSPSTSTTTPWARRAPSPRRRPTTRRPPRTRSPSARSSGASVSTTSDLDYFKFDGTAGQTEIFFTDSISAASACRCGSSAPTAPPASLSPRPARASSNYRLLHPARDRHVLHALRLVRRRYHGRLPDRDGPRHAHGG